MNIMHIDLMIIILSLALAFIYFIKTKQDKKRIDKEQIVLNKIYNMKK